MYAKMAGEDYSVQNDVQNIATAIHAKEMDVVINVKKAGMDCDVNVEDIVRPRMNVTKPVVYVWSVLHDGSDNSATKTAHEAAMILDVAETMVSVTTV